MHVLSAQKTYQNWHLMEALSHSKLEGDRTLMTVSNMTPFVLGLSFRAEFAVHFNLVATTYLSG